MAVLLFLGATQFVLAQAPPDTFGVQPVGETVELGGGDIRVIIGKIIRAVLGLLGALAVGIIVYAGFVIMTSGGNEEKVAQGRRILINAVIGLLIILSAVAIVQFILNALSRATGIGVEDEGPVSPRTLQTFAGSGSLGRIIKDHYPFRDQTGVKRNSKVMVTFREPIDPASLIENTNRSCWEKQNPAECTDADTPKLGDCLADDNFDWRTDCDQLKVSAVRIFKTEAPDEVVEAAALAVYEETEISPRSALTFVFRSFELLGDALQSVRYTVDLTRNIKKLEPNKTLEQEVSAFVNDRDGHYAWSFETDTTADFAPPHVVSVYPSANQTVPRNSLIQINFNEAMDPTSVQGLVGPNQPFTNLITNLAGIAGEWKLSNGYQTVEFVSDQACGQNSCGDLMYCLPIGCNDQNDRSCTAGVVTLIRTADLQTQNSFEAFPFSGVMDVAGNALDGDNDGVADGKPALGNPREIGDTERAADNYFWSFTLQNTIDRAPPYLERVLPGLDQEDVVGNAPLSIQFNRLMWSATLSDIQLEEYPTNVNNLAEIWFRPSAEVADGKTVVRFQHREFGPNGEAMYYFPQIPSTVKSVNQNCLYPGRGPDGGRNTSPVCDYQVDQNNQVIANNNCVDVNVDSTTDTGCVQTTNVSEKRQADVGACLLKLRELSPR